MAVLISATGRWRCRVSWPQTYPAAARNTFASAYLGRPAGHFLFAVQPQPPVRADDRQGLLGARRPADGDEHGGRRVLRGRMRDEDQPSSCGVEMPIARMVYGVLYDGESPSVSVGRPDRTADRERHDMNPSITLLSWVLSMCLSTRSTAALSQAVDLECAERAGSRRPNRMLSDGSGNGRRFSGLGFPARPDRLRGARSRRRRARRSLASLADVIVVIGIGGSYLGTKAVLRSDERLRSSCCARSRTGRCCCSRGRT